MSNEIKEEILGGNKGFTRENILDTLTILSEDFSFLSFPMELKAGIVASNILATMYKGEQRETPAHTIPLEKCIEIVRQVLESEPDFIYEEQDSEDLNLEN